MWTKLVTDIEQLLLAKALEDAESVPSMGQTALGGLGLGAGLGALQGATSPIRETSTPNQRRKSLNDEELLEQQMLETFNKAKGNKANLGSGLRRRGTRMAVGSLLGAVLGGGLGAGTKAMFLSGMPNQAAEMLSKIQTSPEGLSEAEQLQLRAILRQIYSGQ